MPFILLVRCWQALRGWLWCRYVRWPTRIMNPMNLYLQQIGFHVHINKNLGVYWQFKSLPLAFVDVTSCRFHLNFLSIVQYDNQWTSDGPLWQLHEVRSAYSACISTQRHGHEKRLLRTIFGGEKVLETSSMFGIEIPGVVAVTVLTVLPLRRRLLVLAVSSILFYFNQYRQDKVQISRNWPGVAWHLLLELQWFNPYINGKQGVIGGPKRHGHIGCQRPGVFNEQRWSILVSVSVLPLTWEWPEFAPKRWRSMAHDGSMRRMWGKKSAQKGKDIAHPLTFLF